MSKKRKNPYNITQTSIKDGIQKKKAKTEPKKFKPVTVQEINELKDTYNLYHSNLFRLQNKQMLAEIKISEKYRLFINDWMERFNMFLNDLPTEEFDNNNIPWLQSNQIKLPSLFETLTQKIFPIEFNKPTNKSFLIGSAAPITLVGKSYVVDVCVEIPGNYFSKNDYLNLMYDYKRIIYITYIASKLAKTTKFEDIKIIELNFNYFANNPLKPVLEITSISENITNNIVFRLYFVPDESDFKMNRFVPWNNNIRSSVFNENTKYEDKAPFATPNYNANVLFDITMKTNNIYISECLQANNNFQEALILIKVWLYQRQLNIGFNGFQGYIMSALIVYLYKKRKVYSNMSSYQVVKNVWNFLACSSWDETSKGISLYETNMLSKNQPTLEHFHTYYDVVFVDSTGYLNICANLCLDVYHRVRSESKLAVDMLNDKEANCFDILFLTKYPVYVQFDHILKISKIDVITRILKEHSLDADKHNYIGNSYPQLIRILTRLLRKGLSDRIFTIIPIEKPCIPWSINAKSVAINENIQLGFSLNPLTAFDIFTKGPQANDDSSNEFRQFWGEKSELRRFQDGSISETCVWCSSSDSLSQKRQIVRHIVEYLLNHHLNVLPTEIYYAASEMDAAYQLNKSFNIERINKKLATNQNTDAEVTSLAIIKSFDDLGQKLRSLELPIEITMISGISPVFRYCDPVPCLPQARFIKENLFASQVHKGIVQIGTKSKWPNQLPALRALKIALYIQIVNILKEKYKYESKVTFDGFLILKDGFVFSLEISHPKEILLVKKEITESGIVKYIDNANSIFLQKQQVTLPKVTQALHALYQTHPSFGPSVMIAKRWLGAHLIDDGIWPEECTELLIAYQFLRTKQQRNPVQPQTGFFRFLHLLANSDWKSEMFLVNFNEELKKHEISELENRFNSERETFPPLCIVTAYDLTCNGSQWSSKSNPNVHVLARVTLLARHAVKLLEDVIFSTKLIIKASQLLTTSNSGYDFVIELQPDTISNCMAKEFPSPFTIFRKPSFKMPLAGQNLIKHSVDKLREAFSNFGAFFYNPYGGKEIAVLWKPNVFNEKEFKVADVNGSSLSKCHSKLNFDETTLIADIEIVLKNLCMTIKKI